MTISFICPECHVALLRQHPEMPHQWLKCGLCGFSKPIRDEDEEVIEEEHDTRAEDLKKKDPH